MNDPANINPRRTARRSPRLFILLVLCLAATPTWANNISISNVDLVGQNATDNYVLVQFDISWEHSWRVSSSDPFNWDAAWVFVKFRVSGNVWKHATLHTSGHTVPGGATLDTPSDGKGVFIYRSADGSGTVNFSAVQLRWNYGVDGVGDDDELEIQVFGIEMVYVPQGSYALGTGGSENGAFYEYPTSTNSYTVGSEAAINVGTTNGYLYYPASVAAGDQSGPIPAAFPKGYAAFYSMKYETTQRAYVEFLNLLTYDQQATRTSVSPDAPAGTSALLDGEGEAPPNKNFRNGIEIEFPGTASTMPAVYANDYTDDGTYDQPDDGQDIACNLLRWGDLAAYADWAGLRPMTELEYEKAGRGASQAPVPDAYAWGTTSLHGSPYSVSNDGRPDATISTPPPNTGNASYNATDGSLNGPLRTGIFAASYGSPSRVEAGAGYYGVMEMSGNLWEFLVTAGNPTGRAFTGTHGDGTLTASGEANASSWPAADAVGTGFRGSGWTDADTSWPRLSDRFGAAFAQPLRKNDVGLRCVRTAP